jgi:hypothetical protein
MSRVEMNINRNRLPVERIRVIEQHYGEFELGRIFQSLCGIYLATVVTICGENVCCLVWLLNFVFHPKGKSILKLFVLKRIFGYKRDVATGRWR